MSLLAAVPVAVLVLAWDETAPAVRALVEATETTAPALDSVVVVVPAEAGELRQEEFLPLAGAPISFLVAVDEASIPDQTTPPEKDTGVPLSLSAASLSLPLAAPAAPAPPPLGALTEIVLQPTAPLAWSAVRVLRLSSFSLPELTALSNQALPRPIWQRGVVPPAAPYLGSQPETADNKTSVLVDRSLAPARPAAAVRSILREDASFPPSPTPLATAQPEQLPPTSPVPVPAHFLTELPLPALDAEADLASTLPAELATKQPAPTEAPLAEAMENVQAGWSEALASLRTPLPIDEPTPATDFEDEASYYAAMVGELPATASAGPAELRPVSQLFEAPDLNYQVIQYARFAVPVALAQAPFAAIYAPAWPTWLAAQELRQRTRQPLVLHVATLAAGADDSLETATGWQAELQRQALHRADLILAETPALTRRLRQDLGLSPEVVRTVPAADAAAVAQALRTAQVRASDSPT